MTHQDISTGDTSQVGYEGGVRTQLQGKLGLGSIVFSIVAWAAPLLVVVGLMPSIIGFAGNGIVAGFAMTTAILLFFSVGYTALTRYVKRPGAFYTYITEGLGRKTGLGGAFVAIFGYMMLLLSTWVALGVYTRQLIADTLGGPEIPWYVCGIFGILVTGFFAYRHIEFSAKILGIALLFEIAIVVVFNVASFGGGGPEGIPTTPLTLDAITEGNFGLAMLFAALCFIGFECSAIYREEAKNPDKTIPRATYVAVILIGVFYVVTAWALLTALGRDGVASASEGNVATLFGETAANLMGTMLPDLINVLVVTSTFACLLAAHNTVARYGYSLGRDGVFPRKMGEAHRRHHSPFLASLMLTVLEIGSVAIIALSSKFDPVGSEAFTVYIRMNGLGALSIVFLMCLVSVAILGYFAMNVRPKKDSGTWRAFIAPGISLIGLLVILALGIVNVDALIDAGTLVSGLLALLAPIVFFIGYLYASSLQRNKPEVFAKIGRQ